MTGFKATAIRGILFLIPLTVTVLVVVLACRWADSVNFGERDDAISSSNGFVGLRQWWTDQWRSNANYSLLHADNDPAISNGVVNKSAWSASVNLIYSPVPTQDFGLDFMHAERELENGASGNFDRFQFSGTYFFSFSAQDGS